MIVRKDTKRTSLGRVRRFEEYRHESVPYNGVGPVITHEVLVNDVLVGWWNT